MITILRFAIIGLLISLSSSYTLMTIDVLTTPGIIVTGEDLLKQLIIAAILGVAIGLISVIFETDYFSFTFQLFIHLVTVITCVFIAGYFGGWYDVTNKMTLVSLLISVIIIYIISWGIILLVMKRVIGEINHAIQKRRKGL
ncbi:DUF3021 family protein [Psychrobacillus sp.]|uniref:DUF3021 family protein n=1 Tax=Psychrobacillus sp. TaxID=1871623 RepID=UPI0028BE575E|nr:DUF3021 family protein [Psychrobacillus sp.]